MKNFLRLFSSLLGRVLFDEQSLEFDRGIFLIFGGFTQIK